MKVLLCHNHYQQPGGEDQSFDDEARLLEARGHTVLRFTLHNNVIPQMGRLRLAARTLWHGDVYRRLRDLLRAERPQVMHCTNTFPLISPAAYYAARRAGVPVVQSLRNYRLLCANSLFLRDGRACEECLGRKVQWPAIVHRCYRGELGATAMVAAMVSAHRAVGTWRRAVDMYFTPSEFARRKFIEGGFSPDRIAVKPNFVFPDPGVGAGARGGAIFVGRLAPEKGIEVLLDAWLRHGLQLPLRIIGDGPLAERVADACRRSDRIEWLGRRPLAEALSHIGDASLLVAPSITYETFGRSVAEAFAKGTPVLVSDYGASAELVTSGVSGLHFRSGDADDLAAKVRELTGDPTRLARMREPARLEYVQKFNGDINYDRLMSIYDRAISFHGAPPSPSAVPQRAAGAITSASSFMAAAVETSVSLGACSGL
ncbi:MAG TPA: glycosyltransferase family 4 protein [Tepidisphaeraceae bacterium]|nr:glycosyltransferase family 4 protein [Tepidisphaeraceae bacterium]